MEGIAMGTEFIGSIFAYLGGIALLAFVVSAVKASASEKRRKNRVAG